MLSKSLNQILFGPPGTGKTFNTINMALKITDPDYFTSHQNDRKKLRERFKQLLVNDWENPQKGQISFCTFHQSFSYEDFIEGIKPVLQSENSEESEKSIGYTIEDGIFKRMADRARHFASDGSQKDRQRLKLTEEEFGKAHFYKLSLGDINLAEDNAIYDYCIENNLISIGFMDNDLTGLTESAISELARKEEYGKFEPQALNYFIHYLKQKNYVVVSKGNRKIRAIGKVVGDYFYDMEAPIRHNHFRKVEWIVTNAEIPVEELYQKTFSMQTIYKLNSDWVNKDFFVHDALPPAQEVIPNFVLIIDEINRGNISQIFGELITLIEADKREGMPEELSTTLPYSKEEFGVPSNLHIIGTMNTADRSIEALDTALRRRFTFVEMPPQPEIISLFGESKGHIEGIDLVLLLQTINSRIEKLLDKDHQIGHSYFLDIENLDGLQFAFKNKIVPLLEEYFYGDMGKIGLVLGDAFVQEKVKNTFDFASFKGFDADTKNDLKERKVYQITPQENWTTEAFQSIYKTLT